MTGKPHTIEPHEAWKMIQKNWIIQVVNKSVIVCIVISILLIVWRWGRLPPAIPLWYSRPWGSDQLASPFWVLLLPLGGILIYYMNVAISVYMTAQYLIFTQMLFLSSLLVNILSLITLVKILFLVS
jgi:hypothetical protein